MNRFSRIRHHVDMKDVKQRHLEELAAKKNKEKQIEEEKILRQKIYNACKSNWREDILDEGMTTGNVFSTTLSAEGETAINTVNPIDPASYTGTTGVLNFGDDLGANVGTVIRDNGTGIGADGGFNVGGKYLAFQGVGSGTNNSRFAALSPIDSSTVDTLSITAVIGNDVNGGEDPDLTSEGLFVMYKTPAMANASFLMLKPDNTLGDGDGIIIPSPASHNGGLNNYSIKIPEYARAKDTQFILLQFFNSGSEFDHYGITNINFKRRAPLNVIVPLDDPSAISFISVGTNEGDPKKRKKKINDQLEASDKYTKSVMGSQFPGQGTRIDGDDPFRSTTVTSDEDIKASPIGSDEVKKSFGDFQKTNQTPEQIKAQNDEYLVDIDNLLKQNEYNYADSKIIKIADKILKTDPKNKDAYFYKLGTQYETGDMKGAIKTTDEMINNNPDDTTGYQIRSSLRKNEGDLVGAIEDIEKVIELDPDQTYYQDMKKELENASDDDVQSKLDDYVKKSTPEPSKFVDDSKPTDEGRGITLTKWISRTDYRKMYPNTSVVDYLNSLPYGATDFMTPNPKFPGAWDVNTKGYENYFMTGDLSALGNKSGIPKPRHSTATPEPTPEPETDFSNVPKTSEQRLADLDAAIAKYSAAEQAAYAEMKRIALEFGIDVISLVGGLFTGGASLAGSPTLSKLLLKLAKKSGKGLFGKLVRNILRRTQKKDVNSIDDISDFIDKQNPKTVPAGEVGSIDPVTGLPRGGAGQNIGLPDIDKAAYDRKTSYSLDPILGKINKKKKKEFYVGLDLGRGPDGKDVIYKPFYNSYKLDGTNLFERIKSKPFFNPKDIKPPFPDNDPPQLDPKTGMHPDYGKTAGRYKKLDPISANAMPPTGDPETDAVVDKQRTKPKSQLFSKIKRLTRKG